MGGAFSVNIKQESSGVRVVVSGALEQDVPVGDSFPINGLENALTVDKNNFVFIGGGGAATQVTAVALLDLTNSVENFSCIGNVVARFEFSTLLGDDVEVPTLGFDTAALFYPANYTRGTFLDGNRLLGGYLISELGLIPETNCSLTWDYGKVEFLVGSETSFANRIVTFYTNAIYGNADITYNAFEAFCRGNDQALCRYDTLCPSGEGGDFLGDPDCDSQLSSGDLSTYVLRNSGEGCDANDAVAASTGWSTLAGGGVCNASACSPLTGTQVMACCALTKAVGGTQLSSICGASLLQSPHRFVSTRVL